MVVVDNADVVPVINRPPSCLDLLCTREIFPEALLSAFFGVGKSHSVTFRTAKRTRNLMMDERAHGSAKRNAGRPLGRGARQRSAGW